MEIPACPQCKKRVVWKFCYPNDRKHCRCVPCGFSWFNQIEILRAPHGNYIGDWEGDEMVEIETKLKVDEAYSGPTDWRMFKGKSVWTAWREKYPKHFIIVHSFDELVERVVKASKLDDKDYRQPKKSTKKMSEAMVGPWPQA